MGCEVDFENNATLLIQIGKKDVLIDRSYWSNLDLAYAMTIHKSQGSEYDVVVIPMTTSHFMMLKRNLLYTAITRAKKLRSEEHTSELQSLMRISYSVFCLKKNKICKQHPPNYIY